MEPIMIMYAGYEGYKMVRDFVGEAKEFTDDVKGISKNVKETADNIKKTMDTGEKIWQKIQYYYEAKSTGIEDYISLEKLTGESKETYKIKHEKALRLLRNSIYQTNVSEIMEDLEDLGRNNGVLFYQESLLEVLPFYQTMKKYGNDFNIKRKTLAEIESLEERSEASAKSVRNKIFIPLPFDSQDPRNVVPDFLLMPKIHFATLMGQGKIKDNYVQMKESHEYVLTNSRKENKHSVIGPLIRLTSIEDYKQSEELSTRKIELEKHEAAEQELINLFEIHSHYTLNASSNLTGADFCHEEGKQHLVAYLTQDSPSEKKKDRIAVVDSSQNFKSVINFDTKFNDPSKLSTVLSLYFAKGSEIIACDDSGTVHLVDPTRKDEKKRVHQLKLGYIPAEASYINEGMYAIKLEKNTGQHGITVIKVNHTEDKKELTKEEINFRIDSPYEEFTGYEKMSFLERNNTAYILAQSGSNNGKENRLYLYEIENKTSKLKQNISKELGENNALTGASRPKYDSIMEVSYQGDYVLLNNKGSVLDFYKWNSNNKLNFVGSKEKDAIFAGLISNEAFYSINTKGTLEISPIYAGKFKTESKTGKYTGTKVLGCKFVKSNDNAAGSYILVAYKGGNNEVFYVK